MSTYSDVINATPGLIAYYRLGESSGTSTVDDKGGYNGTYGGTYTLGVPAAVAGDPNTSATFDGSSAYGSVPVPVGTSGGYTIEAWAKPSGTSGVRNIFCSAATTSGGYAVQLRQDGASWNLYHTWSFDRNARHANGVVANVWTHVVATWDGSAIRLYNNGTLRAVATGVTGIQRAGGSSWIACDGNDFNGGRGQYWSGGLDEISIYNRALTDAEVASHYAAGLPVIWERWEIF